MTKFSVRPCPENDHRFSRPALKVLTGLFVAGIATVAMVAGATPAFAAGYEQSVELGTADPYSVLAGSTVTNTGASTLSGSLGVSPGSAIVGFPPGLAGGATNAGNASAASAQSSLTAAYLDAAGRTATGTSLGSALVGGTLQPGVYNASSSLGVSGAVTLDGQGDPNSVFIFQIGAAMTTASSTSIVLVGAAQACNVFWQVGTSATLGTTNTFVGTIMALTSVTVTTGTTVKGRALARNGAVTLDNNVFTSPSCAAAPTTTTITATPTSSGATLTAKVTSTGGPNPTGTVTFTSNGVTLGTAPVDANGVATLAIKGGATPQTLANIVATFAATPRLATSASGTTTVVVTATELASTGPSQLALLGGTGGAVLLGGIAMTGLARRRSAQD